MPQDPRPLAVWVIAIFYLLSIVSTLLSLVSVLTGVVEVTPAQQRYFDSLGPVDYLGNSLILREPEYGGITMLDTTRIHVEAAVREMVVG